MKSLTLNIRYGLLLLLIPFTLACTNNWDNHYSADPDVIPAQSLWESIGERPELLSDFAELLQLTDYDKVLDADQVYTIWAPANGHFNIDSLRALIDEGKKDQVIAEFVKNHIARFSHPVSSLTDKQVLLLSKKSERLRSGEAAASFLFGQTGILSKNILSSNGILHIIDRANPFFFNIYEYLKTDTELDSLTSFIYSFDKAVFDPLLSVPYGVVDGKTIYVDSVISIENELLEKIGLLNHEDSTYWLLAPSNSAWNQAYDSIRQYFKYDLKVAKADSLEQANTKMMMVRDLVFNAKLQSSPQDSLFSTQYQVLDKKYHVYHRPYEAGNIFSRTTEEVSCSNGVIFKSDDWFYRPEQNFYQEIKVEAERTTGRDYSSSLCDIMDRVVKPEDNYKISNKRYIHLMPAGTSRNPWVTFEIPNTLSAAYDIYCVFVPYKYYNPAHENVDKPVKLKFSLTYNDEKGNSRTIVCRDSAGSNIYETDPSKLDTVLVLSNYTFPVANYGQENNTVMLKLETSITSKETALYTREMLIDCICLKPHLN